LQSIKLVLKQVREKFIRSWWEKSPSPKASNRNNIQKTIYETKSTYFLKQKRRMKKRVKPCTFVRGIHRSRGWCRWRSQLRWPWELWCPNGRRWRELKRVCEERRPSSMTEGTS